jgi:ATP-binding cassette subfamily C (CFTR/MRP) protein 4
VSRFVNKHTDVELLDFDEAGIGLLLSQYFSLFSSFQWGLRQWGEIETQVVSLERLHEYTKIPGEPVRPEATQISEMWPEGGLVEFRNVSLKYKEGQKYVLKNLNFTIEPKEKVGIVGRTGAGKSSLISSLFQVHPIEGNVFIDGLDVTGISLKQTRSKVSIIPQEPFLFSATMRKNLDPFDEYSDDVLWKALEEVELKNMIKEHPSGLHCKVTEKGSNFSVGQRQLVCLARALVKNNKILVLDEATANVDPTTDELIQKSVRDKFMECTVLTVAHRLNTVMDSDRILVMSDGKVEEFDHPFLLLQNKNGVFYSMVESTGRVTAHRLKSLAEKVELVFLMNSKGINIVAELFEKENCTKIFVATFPSERKTAGLENSCFVCDFLGFVFDGCGFNKNMISLLLTIRHNSNCATSKTLY